MLKSWSVAPGHSFVSSANTTGTTERGRMALRSIATDDAVDEGTSRVVSHHPPPIRHTPRSHPSW